MYSIVEMIEYSEQACKSRYRLHGKTHHQLSQIIKARKYEFSLLLLRLNVCGVGSLLGVLNVIGDLVETNLLGDPLSSCSVLGTGFIVEDSIDLF